MAQRRPTVLPANWNKRPKVRASFLPANWGRKPKKPVRSLYTKPEHRTHRQFLRERRAGMTASTTRRASNIISGLGWHKGTLPSRRRKQIERYRD